MVAMVTKEPRDSFIVAQPILLVVVVAGGVLERVRRLGRLEGAGAGRVLDGDVGIEHPTEVEGRAEDHQQDDGDERELGQGLALRCSIDVAAIALKQRAHRTPETSVDAGAPT